MDNRCKIETVPVPFGDLTTHRVFIVEGDTIPAINIILSPTTPIDLTGATIEFKLFDDAGIEKASFDSDGNGITILTDKTARIDQIEKEDNNFGVGTLRGQFKITTATGIKKTYFVFEYCIIESD